MGSKWCGDKMRAEWDSSRKGELRGRWSDWLWIERLLYSSSVIRPPAGGPLPPLAVLQERYLGMGPLHSDRPPAWTLYHLDQTGPGGSRQERMLNMDNTEGMLPLSFFFFPSIDRDSPPVNKERLHQKAVKCPWQVKVNSFYRNSLSLSPFYIASYIY